LCKLDHSSENVSWQCPQTHSMMRSISTSTSLPVSRDPLRLRVLDTHDLTRVQVLDRHRARLRRHRAQETVQLGRRSSLPTSRFPFRCSSHVPDPLLFVAPSRMVTAVANGTVWGPRTPEEARRQARSLRSAAEKMRSRLDGE
jgi:hypothetical protein